MKRVLVLVSILMLIFALASCSKKKSHDYKEQVSKEISAEEGGKIESSDGKTSVDIPAGALDENTTITMTVYDASGYSDENGKIVSKVVDFEPTGTIFKKPVIITMATDEKIEGKTISAAVYDEKEEKWSYSQGFYLIIKDGKNEAGDPIMQTTDGKEISLDNGNLTAGGEPIMMTNATGDPIMTNAAGDPIMMSAAGDPIMLVSSNAAGDPIMTNAAGDPIMIGTSSAGDPIMTSAAGDPIMMTTGHFTTFTFISTDPRKEKPVEPVENDDDEPLNDEDETPDEVKDEDETPDETEDEDIIPEPEKVYSLVPCTGLKFCANNKDQVIECPVNETADFYGQDVQYAIRRSCVTRSFETLYPEENEDEYEMPYPMVYDNVTKLTWLPTDISTEYEDNEHTFCDELEYAGHDDWRFPTPKEIQTLTIKHITTQWGTVLHPVYFADFNNSFPSYLLAVDEDNHYCYDPEDGDIVPLDGTSYCNNVYYMCVRGEEYGKVDDNTYEIRGEGNEQVVFDLSTNLWWQKGSVSGKTWKEAFAYCENLNYAGYSDWRLPNRNELMTLVDYSKSGTDVVSSFPGMEAEEFITSTFIQIFPEVGYWTYKWIVSMNNGAVRELDLEDEYGEELIYSVRCVRSDLDAAPADGIPECDEKIGYTPCRDSVNNIVWSMVIMEPGEETGYYNWHGAIAAETCTNAVMHGKNKWRLPTVDELRTLMKDDKLKSGGECGVTSLCLESNCSNNGACSLEEDAVLESKFFDYGMLISGDIIKDEDRAYNKVWVIDRYPAGFSELSVFEDTYSRGSIFSTVVRCVLDESLNNKEAPYTQDIGENKTLEWSSVSQGILLWNEAAKYCRELEEDGHDDWRVPEIEELYRLLKNGECEENCIPDLSGASTLFGDITPLWSATMTEILGDNDVPIDKFTFLYPAAASTTLAYPYDSESGLYTYLSYYAKVRCVRASYDEPVEVLTFPQYIPGTKLWWSEASEPCEPDAEGSFLSCAEDYCESLNALEYGDRSDWSLPTADDLYELINMEACIETNGADTHLCEGFSFNKGYSIFGDMFHLISSGGTDFMNFETSAYDEEPDDYHADDIYRVRCIARD